MCRRSLRLCLVGSLILGAATGCRLETGVSELVVSIQSQPSTLGVWKESVAAGCGTPASAGEDTGAGHILFRLPSGHAYRLPAHAGSKPRDVSAALDAMSPGKDFLVTGSSDGEWLMVTTSRFGCGEDACAALVDARACRAQVIVADGDMVHPNAHSAVAPHGAAVVYPAHGVHPMDLFAVTRAGDGWSSPVNLTAHAPTHYNQQPVVSPDGKRVLFDCGSDPGSGPGTSICEVGLDGAGLHVAIAAGLHGRRGADHHAAFAPDGSIVFEGTWAGGAEQVWRARPGQDPTLVNQETNPEDASEPVYSDDNSPCVLPDGRIASLWLGRKGAGVAKKGSGHELKVMGPDGSGGEMLLIDVDVVDTGIVCTR